MSTKKYKVEQRKNITMIIKVKLQKTLKNIRRIIKKRLINGRKNIMIIIKKRLNKITKYHENNKEKINKKCICQCGGIYTYSNKARHEKTENT